MKKIIFGAGGLGKEAVAYYGMENVAYFVDNDINKIGKDINGIPILSFDQLLDIASNYVVVVALKAYSTVIEQLNSAGITNIIYFEKEKSEVSVNVKTEEVMATEEIEQILSAYEPVDEEKISNQVLYVGCNTDNANFGCRATSIALYEILTQRFEISDVLYREELLSLFTDVPFIEDVFHYVMEIRTVYADKWNNLKNRVKQAGRVIINGEGSFIFQTPHRLDLHNFAVLMMICIESRVPFYIINAMVSYGKNVDEKSDKLFERIIKLFQKATCISVRDKVSYDLISGRGINTVFYPDALFSWYKFYSEYNLYFENVLSCSKCCLPFEKNQGLECPIDFTKKYILFSGNSYAAHFPQKAYKSFSYIVKALKIIAQNNGVQLYLIECCGGDYILRNIAIQERVPLIPVETNIRLAGYILGKAELFISGRYHPSILASLGGAECVFMDSNSHKTESLQEILKIQENSRRVFSAMPMEDEAEELVNYVEFCIKRKNANREYVKQVCKENMCEVSKINTIF